MREPEGVRAARSAIHAVASIRAAVALAGASVVVSALLAMVAPLLGGDVVSAASATSQARWSIAAAGATAGLAAAAAIATAVGGDREHGADAMRTLALPGAVARGIGTTLAMLFVATCLALVCGGAALLAAWPVLDRLVGGWAPTSSLLVAFGAAAALGAIGSAFGALSAVAVRSAQQATALVWAGLVAAPAVLTLGQLAGAARLTPGGLAASAVADAARGELSGAVLGIVAWVCALGILLRCSPLVRRWSLAVRPHGRRTEVGANASVVPRALRPAAAAVFDLLGSRPLLLALLAAALHGVLAATTAAGAAEPLDAEGGGFGSVDTYALGAGQPVAQLLAALIACALTAEAVRGRSASSWAVAMPRRSTRALSMVLAPGLLLAATTLVAMVIAVPAVSIVLDLGGVSAEQRDGALLAAAARHVVAAGLTGLLAAALAVLLASAVWAAAALTGVVVIVPMLLGTLSFSLAADGDRTPWLDAAIDLLPGQVARWSNGIPAAIDVSQPLVAGLWLAIIAASAAVVHHRRDLA